MTLTGFSVNTWAVGDLVQVVNSISDGDVNALVDEYESCYTMTPATQIHGEKRQNVLEAARIELGMKRFLEQGGFHAFTTTFEDLHGLKQLPGLAVQRLMQQGYGFAGEGDWKTAALLRIMKVMSTGLQGGTSFMEDYTYHFEKGNDLVLGSHMLEVCPSIAVEEKPILDVQHLGIGGKDDPARLIFNTQTGPAIVASLIDLGDRYRLLVNCIDTVKTPHSLPKLPVANALWKAQPDLPTASEAWILAGGAHHTVFSHALNLNDMRQFAEMHDIEITVIDNDTRLPAFKDALRWNEVYYAKILIGEVTVVDESEPFAHEKLSPTLAMYRAKDFEDAVEKAEKLVAMGGIGHTSCLYTDQDNQPARVSYFGQKRLSHWRSVR